MSQTSCPARPLAALLLAVGVGVAAVPAAHAQSAPSAAVADERFAINAFLVEGNSILTPGEVDAAVTPFTGKSKVYGDIQKALEALERAYRARGFAAVQVFLPEQTVESGTVRITVVEAKLSKVDIKGNVHFDQANIRSALPSLRVGQTPNTLAISSAVRAANENPARQVDVILGVGAKEDEVTAEVQVTDYNPFKVFFSLDNTGSPSTGKTRLSAGMQHGNLFNADHVVTAQYTTSPEKPRQVSIFSLGYRVPLYNVGGAVDAFVAKSNVSSGTTATVAGPLSFTGKGDILGARYNHYLPRVGEYTHKLIAGVDYRAFKNDCTLGTFGAAGCGGAAYPVTLKPISLTYYGEWSGVGRQTGFNLGLTHNFGGGSNGTDNAFDLVKGGGVGNTPTFTGMRARYTILRGGVSHVQVLPADFQLRAGMSFQIANQPLVPQEQFGFAGSTSVRGFTEREVARDKGAYANIELYGPEWGKTFGEGVSFRLLGFYDFGTGTSYTYGATATPRESISSAGLGLRVSVGRLLTLRGDLGRVLNTGGAQGKGDSRAHVSMTLSF